MCVCIFYVFFCISASPDFWPTHGRSNSFGLFPPFYSPFLLHLCQCWHYHQRFTVDCGIFHAHFSFGRSVRLPLWVGWTDNFLLIWSRWAREGGHELVQISTDTTNNRYDSWHTLFLTLSFRQWSESCPTALCNKLLAFGDQSSHLDPLFGWVGGNKPF